MTVSIVTVNTSTPNSGGGDTIYTAFSKVNNNTGNLALAVNNLQATYANTSYGVFANITVTNQVIGRMNFSSAGGGGVFVDGSPVATSAASFTGGNVPSQANFIATTSSTSKTTGAVVVYGGMGVAQDVNIGGSVNSTGDSTIGGNLTVQGAKDSSNSSTGAIVVTGGLGVGKNLNAGQNIYVGGAASVTGTLSAGGDTTISSTTISVGSTSGALIVSGGTGIAGNLNVGGTTNTQDLNVAGNITVTGNAVLGSQTVTITDNLIELHTYANLAPLTSDDGKDIGIRFHYYRAGGAGDKEAALTLAHDTNAMEFYITATETAGQISGTYGTYKGGAVIAANTTAATSTSTGALQVAGGAGIVGNLYVGGNIISTSTGFTQVASGNSAQRPNGPNNGMIRYNSDITSFEGYYAGAWSSLGGVKSVDGKAYIQAENSAGAGDDVLRFYAGDSGSSTQVMWASTSNIKILPTTTSTSTTTGALQVAGGVGVAGNIYSGGTVSATSVTATNLTGTLQTASQTNITSVGTLSGLTVSAAIVPNGNGTVTLGSSGAWWSSIYGTAVHAQYADLAEKYLADADYDVGTVVAVGGNKEVTACQAGDLAIGAVSANPAFKMNDGLTNGTFIALKGRVPVKVVGPVVKGQRLIAGASGCATAVLQSNDVFAIALETNNDTGVKLVEAVIL